MEFYATGGGSAGEGSMVGALVVLHPGGGRCLMFHVHSATAGAWPWPECRREEILLAMRAPVSSMLQSVRCLHVARLPRRSCRGPLIGLSPWAGFALVMR